MVNEVSAWATALKMMEEGLRPPLVHAATGIAKDKLRETFRQIHGESAIQGRVPEHAHRRIHNKLQVIEATIFVRLYQDMAGETMFRQLDSSLVMDAYRLYKETIAMNYPIDAQTAWYLARDIREGVVEIKHCQKCGNEYLYDHRSDYLRRCLFCRG